MHKENRKQIKVKAEQAAVKEQKIDCQFMPAVNLPVNVETQLCK
jgi:hypothetical protein